MDDFDTSLISHFDMQTSTNHLKMLKAVFSYLPQEKKGYLCVYIKYAELLLSISLLKKPKTFYPRDIDSSEQSPRKDFKSLLGLLKSLSDEKDKQFFEQLDSILQAFETFEQYGPMLQTMMQLNEMSKAESTDCESNTESKEDSSSSEDFYQSILKSTLSSEQLDLFEQFKNSIQL